LENQGFIVLTALRGEEALDMLRATRVDLVITEAILSGMDGYELVRQIREQDAWLNLPVIMLTVRNAPEDYILGFEAGVNEYFVKPIDEPKLLGVAKGLIQSRGRTKLVRVGAHFDGGHGPVHGRTERGKIVTVFSLKGGVGTSTIAVNLAVAIKELVPSARVGLIDLCLEEGLDALMLDIVPTSTILEWARENAEETTPYLLNQYFIQHRSGISLLAAPPSPEDAEIVHPEVVRRTLEMARQTFDYLVLDTSSTFSETSLIALESADTVVLPLTPDMAALKTTVSTVRVLKAVRITEEKLRFVLNEIVPRAGLTQEQVEGSLSHKVYAIPHAGSSFIEASNHGMPLTTVAPPPPAAKAVFTLARTMCEEEQPMAEAARGVVKMSGLRTVLGFLRRA
jgi:pilus assembly protein CpaE